MSDDAAELVAAVTRAIEEGSSVRVRYFAGSSPGAERVLSPITLTDVHITAKPAGQYQAKRYLLAELELVVDGKPSARPPVRPPVIFSDMASLGEHITNLLGGLGWNVAATPSDITVHRRRKNGTPLKGAELVMSFRETDTRQEYDDDLNMIETTYPRARPYSVNGIAFSDFAKAQFRMCELATSLTSQPSSA